MYNYIYRITHRVLSTFKLVYGHLNGIFLTGNFAWVFFIPFVNSGQKDQAKFPNFDPCTVCGKKVRVSKWVLLPAFWATPPYYSIACFLGHTPYYSYKEPMIALLTTIWIWIFSNVHDPGYTKLHKNQTLQILCLLSHQPFWHPLFSIDIQIAVSSAIIVFFITVIRGVAQKAGNTVIRGCGPKSR